MRRHLPRGALPILVALLLACGRMGIEAGSDLRFEISFSPAVSEVRRLRIDPAAGGVHRLEVTDVIPPIEVPADTDRVKRIKMRSELLSEFWGRDVVIGATVLLPRGYEEDRDVRYPTVYRHGHFSLRPPFGYGRGERGEELAEAWESDDFPRFIAVTMQHPTPYFDDSYAVNSVNNGPYGDAIHQELIPELGPSLVGKLHVITGDMDNFYLNVGVYHMEEFLESTSDPYYDGSFTFGARGGHGWRPYRDAELLRIMAAHIRENAPAGVDTSGWVR